MREPRVGKVFAKSSSVRHQNTVNSKSLLNVPTLQVDEETRAEMFKLRQTWNNIFPQMKLYAIDVQISMLDPAWPVTAQPPSNSIHFNPKFLKTTKNKAEMAPIVPEPATAALDMETFTMQQKLIQKQKELIELQQKKLKLELLQTQVKLQKQLESNPNAVVANNLPVRTQVKRWRVVGDELSKRSFNFLFCFCFACLLSRE
jgi:hypothetical protein